MKSNRRNRYQLIITSDLSELQKVEKFTEKMTHKIDFSEEERDSIAISITEIVGNAISHGNKNCRDKTVIIDYYLSSNKLTITVQDEGEGFDINKIDNPLDPQNLLKESGRGIYIVRTLMDNVEFEANKKGTLVRLMKIAKSN